MDGVNIPSETVPDGLKVACEQTLKRARELKKAEPVVAYWCCFSAAQRALKFPNRSKEGTMWLMSLLDALEQMKAILAANEAVANEAAGAAHVENFALKVFMSADNDDRAGATGKATIRKFVVAGQFIEVLRCFENGMTEEMEQKLQYARWKAADGAKALREGREPTSGPPVPEAEISPFPELPSSSPGAGSSQLPQIPHERGSSSSFTRPDVPSGIFPGVTPPVLSPRPSPSQNDRADLPAFDTSSHDVGRTPPRANSSASGAWSTVSTPGLADNEDGERHFEQSFSKPLPSAPPRISPLPRSPSAETKNVRFMGPDGAPLSPATTHVTVDSYDAPPVPPGSTIASPPTSPRLASSLPPPTKTRSKIDSPPATGGSQGTGDYHHSRGDSSHFTSFPQPNGSSAPSAIPAPPPPTIAAIPSRPPSVPQSHGLGLTSSPSPHTLSAAPPTRKQVEQTQKHARFAISALDFDDHETARLELRKALASLGG